MLSLIDLLSAATESTGEPQQGSQQGVEQDCDLPRWELFLVLFSEPCTSSLHWLLHFTASVKYRYQSMFAELQSAVCLNHRTKCNRTVVHSVDVQVDFG